MLQPNLHPIVNRHSKFELLSRLGNAVFAKRPMLGELYKQYGMLTLSEFVKKQLDIGIGQPAVQNRKEEVISIIAEQAEKLLGKDIAKSITNQLEKSYFVITSDHHGPITHQNFTHNNLLNSILAKHNNFENVVILSSSNISFDNFSFPRGHLVHDQSLEELAQQLVFFPRKFRPLPVFNAVAYTQESLNEAKKRLDEWHRENRLSNEKVDKIKNILNEIYGDPDVLSQTRYSDQITITNAKLWRNLAPQTTDWPNLIYLEQERIVTSLLLKYHLNSNTLISHLLFDEKYHELLPKYFNGISGAFTMDSKSGTYLFWALPKGQKYRQSLWKKGNKLETIDGSYSVELTPSAIANAIKENEIYPSTLLSFITLGFYYGLTLVGGRNQTTYYTQMKNGLVELLNEIGEYESKQIVIDIPTNKFSFPCESIAFIKGNNGSYLPATFLDLLVYGNENFHRAINDMTNTVTFEQILLRALPTIYRMAEDDENYEEDLLSLTANDIDSLTSFNKNIVFSGEISS